MHMRHRADDGKQLILGVWLKKGHKTHDEAPTDSASYLHRIFEKTPSWWEKNSPVDQTETAEESQLNPYVGMHLKDRQFFSYMGSLTAPPCTSDVQWLMAAQADIILKEDLQKFREFLGAKQAASDGFNHNYRPVQPLNGRTIQTGFFKEAGEPQQVLEAAVKEQMTRLNMRAKKVTMSGSRLGASAPGASAPESKNDMGMMSGIIAACVGLLMVVAAVFSYRRRNAGKELEQMGLTPQDMEYGRPDLVTTAHL